MDRDGRGVGIGMGGVGVIRDGGIRVWIEE
jgi:hypothetical protein